MRKKAKYCLIGLGAAWLINLSENFCFLVKYERDLNNAIKIRPALCQLYSQEYELQKQLDPYKQMLNDIRVLQEESRRTGYQFTQLALSEGIFNEKGKAEKKISELEPQLSDIESKIENYFSADQELHALRKIMDKSSYRALMPISLLFKEKD